VAVVVVLKRVQMSLLVALVDVAAEPQVKTQLPYLEAQALQTKVTQAETRQVQLGQATILLEVAEVLEQSVLHQQQTPSQVMAAQVYRPLLQEAR